MTFTDGNGHLISSVKSSTSRFELGATLTGEKQDPITGIITCKEIRKAFETDENGRIIVEFFLNSYTSIDGQFFEILQSDPLKVNTGDHFVRSDQLTHPFFCYTRLNDELLLIQSDREGRVEHISYSNDHSHQYALIILLLLIIIFLSMTGLFRFKS